MRKPNKIELDLIASCRKQCTVKVDRAFEWVNIADIDNPENEVFLQGDDAAKFIAECDKLYNSVELGFEGCAYMLADEYLILL